MQPPPAVVDVREEVQPLPAVPVLMVAPLLMVEPPPTAVPIVEVQQPHAVEAPPMTLDGKPRHGSFLFDVPQTASSGSN